MSREHFFIPDTQCKPGVPMEHLEAAGNYIVSKQPDVIIHAGDHWDMPSLSVYDKGTKKSHNKFYQDDIDAGLAGMDLLMNPIENYNRMRARKKLKQYKPRMLFNLGNHEERIMRHVNNNPELHGKLSYADLHLDRHGWEVPEYLEPVCIDGVYYAHYFYQPNTGRPLGGMIATRIKNVGFSFTMGHQQGKDLAEKHLSTGKTLRGLVAGSFYQHDEDYKGPQGNRHWRGCIYKHEVQDGDYSMMELGINYLMRKWL